MTKPTNVTGQNPDQEISDAELDAVNGGSFIDEAFRVAFNSAWQLFTSVETTHAKATHDAALDAVNKIRG
jgi:hypothetical protein